MTLQAYQDALADLRHWQGIGFSGTSTTLKHT